ncbi:Bug family tripartite tricarboxylate transporter substrate binding protein [Paracraurococcus lichenis]|uniref:Tripartite tricarboxylate transporter substrate binding protein n=1 Tax=Paracraurococcus lichenis TaxID=3064888 RepID=A0ABT9DU69_9PROT|nr:tripartite tricarboxylate transporter substrate binding protein [Paracraurococcus sp. LOR1-02]MDO9707428.1 tripartite tricarboxylate transporter substrate binding protein [Paracraurococcus sp. LOR1-02]
MLRRALLAAACLLPVAAAAQEAPFPSRTITLLVGFAPGGGTDILARLIAPRLSEELGQPVAVENRTGGGGTIAVVATARAKPDGHTVTLGTLSNNVQVPLAMKAAPFDPVRDVTPLVQVASVPLVMTVPASSPAKDVQGFVALAKAAPGRLNFASNGVGTSQHMAAELFMLATGTRMVHVPYRGSGPASLDLAADVVQVNFDTLSTVLPHIRAERLRGLAVTTRERSEQLPGVPTMIESGIAGYDIDLWYMLCGPAGLPEAVAQRWAEAMNRALADQGFRRKLVEAGFGPAGGTPAAASALVRADIARYGEVIRRAGITLE